MGGITRREFVCAGAASAAAGLAAPTDARGTVTHAVRYVHVEMGAGPYVRADVSQTAERIASGLGLGRPSRISALGCAVDAKRFPEEFALTLEYGSATRMVLRASKAHAGAIEVVTRGRRDSRLRGNDNGGRNRKAGRE